ncbi:hypothetical protein [Candidatus Laterigemmans baculatus]|uniref:hypothetical protein n=1 Tax=Candidatus Laterigemmans baculatus TaxID=2770505 RepID=UPI0013DD6F30|nr:hypothetical protein [Candidatus Laterigemmans baculatus]
MHAHIRSIDALRELRAAVLEWGSRLDDQIFTLRSEARRALEWAAVEQPRYWSHQVAVAERGLQDATARLAALQTTYGGRDRPRATEARNRVNELRRRLRFCQERAAACRGWAAEMERAVDQLIAATSGLQQHAEAGLPTAAAQLAQWIDALDRYADSLPSPNAAPPTSTDQPPPPTNRPLSNRPLSSNDEPLPSNDEPLPSNDEPLP